jgi:nucleoid-associated protein YgaU
VTASGGVSELSIELLFDSYSGYGRMGGPAKAEENEKAAKLDVPSESMEEVNADVTSVVQRFKALIRYEAKLHRPPTVEFIWGEHLDFKGVISSSSVHYTMFNPDGTPVRATISLSITGDEVDALNESKSKTFESPDRTKTRFLGFGEQLFMLADSEYGDPAKWKPIAAANDIMNPRLAGSARQMRVPSLR